MKLLLTLAAAALVGAVVVVDAKTCNLGGKPGQCGKGMACVTPVADPMPGQKGFCVKSCNVGVEGSCPVGSMCWVGTDVEPGAMGGCVKDSMCYPEKSHLDMANDMLVDFIMYGFTELMDDFLRELFVQLFKVRFPPLCEGPEHLKCAEGHFCMGPPWLSPANDTKTCFKYVENMPFTPCMSGTESPCEEEGMMCQTQPGSPPGANGVCVPDGAKQCDRAAKNPGCGKGMFCHPSTPSWQYGYCAEEGPCHDIEESARNALYNQYLHTRWMYQYDIDEMHRKKVEMMIEEWLESPTN